MFDIEEIRTAGFASVPEQERLRALNAQIAYAAARSPYYREALGAVSPLPSLGALTRLPFLTADMLRAQGFSLRQVRPTLRHWLRARLRGEP